MLPILLLLHVEVQKLPPILQLLPVEASKLVPILLLQPIQVMNLKARVLLVTFRAVVLPPNLEVGEQKVGEEGTSRTKVGRITVKGKRWAKMTR